MYICKQQFHVDNQLNKQDMASRYPLYEMNAEDFERLAVHIGYQILGLSLTPFTKGKDDGKDGYYDGIACCYPSKEKPAKGVFVIQAKHSSKSDASCSDSDFRKIVTEIQNKVVELKQMHGLNYYLLFTNRKYTGTKHSEVENKLKDIENKNNVTIDLITKDRIDDYLIQYPTIAHDLKLNQLLLPLEFDDSDIRDIIVELHESLKSIKNTTQNVDFEYPSIKKKI